MSSHLKNSQDKEVEQWADEALTHYLETNNLRKTPERYQVLKAVYSFDCSFSMDELDDRLNDWAFPVSRGTLYNTIKLLLKVHLVECIRSDKGVKYIPCRATDECKQICTVCGKVTAVKAPQLAETLEQMKLKRFSKTGFIMYIYGVCSSCKAIQTKKLRRKQKK